MQITLNDFALKKVSLISVNKIKQETDVMINIPDTDHGITNIRIEGKKDGVKKAKAVSFSKFLLTSSVYIMMTDSICYLKRMKPNLRPPIYH